MPAPPRSFSLHRAAWILPVAAEPVPDGGLLLAHDGKLLACGPFGDVLKKARGGGGETEITEHGRSLLFPGFVNAHCHLELSHLRGHVPAAAESGEAGFVPWVERFLKERRERSDDVAIKASIRLAAAEMKESGTAFVGDISNTLASWEILAEAGMGGVVFHEIFCGSKDAAADASEMVAVATARIAALPPCEGLRASIAPHAPYTVPEALFREISAWAAKHDAPVSVHLAEDAAENEYFRDGRGAFREWFEREGFWPWPPGFRPMGCGSAETLAGWGFWNRRTLAVHGAALWPEDLSLLRESGAALCLCPRSNLYIGGKLPPLCEIFRSGVPLALGTDSLASNHDLNLLREMSHLAEACARLGIAEAAPRRILRMATAGGAAALGMERGRTEFSEGGFPAVMKVSFPSGEKDPEDFLVRRGWEFKIQRLV